MDVLAWPRGKRSYRNRGDPAVIALGTASCLSRSPGRDDRWACLVSGRGREARVPFREGGRDGPWAVSRLGPERCPTAFSIFYFPLLFSFSEFV
jgi:hypothetical protein